MLIANINKAIVDYTSPALCTPVTPSRRQAIRPIVNVPEKDRATDIDYMHKKLVEIARVAPEISSRTDRQTDRHTYHNTSQPLPSAK